MWRIPYLLTSPIAPEATDVLRPPWTGCFRAFFMTTIGIATGSAPGALFRRDAVDDTRQRFSFQSHHGQIGGCLTQLAYGRDTARGNVGRDDHVVHFQNRMI